MKRTLHTLPRCDWAGDDPLYCAYHDHEWGVPVHDDTKIFEMLILEGFQAGLSWITILRKRESFREAFSNWDYTAVARYTSRDIRRLMNNKEIVRNRRKIEAAVKNARAFLRVRREFGTFDKYIWQFTGNRTLRAARRAGTFADLPAYSAESKAMSRDLKKRGFSFVGPTICYAHMQATGMVDDHLSGCFCAKQNDRRRKK
ncbi:MAG: DNA-3-methyladenine glycosylase I [Chitinivibrionales bacterium]|nr:DNA-3-methyladenine glycosylase I [Chitinivibrionales bacterium]MBD3397077.1 DNA-3-methyladenine glycosylase I [Chitinivibrionales bacterium]